MCPKLSATAQTILKRLVPGPRQFAHFVTITHNPTLTLHLFLDSSAFSSEIFPGLLNVQGLPVRDCVVSSNNLAPRRGGWAKRAKNKKIFLYPTKKNNQPGPDIRLWLVQRLRGPISSLSVFNSVQQLQQSFHMWHYLTKINRIIVDYWQPQKRSMIWIWVYSDAGSRINFRTTFPDSLF